MNKHCHRTVFNKTRGLHMAVAECACGQGGRGPGRRGPRTGRPDSSRSAVLRRLTFSLCAALGLAAILPAAQAQIVADRAAPASQQPTVLNAGNGVPLVNIQTPSAAGVSRNTYSQFDVQRQGAILNNARTNALTQLGGWVQGNPWLAGGSARVILNEVNSSNPSHLQGYVEVAGSRAQVVIANPAGVTCDGCGFINAGRAMLTTGTPIVSGGNLEGYLVERGRVSVQGGGLDASQSDYTDIIARAVAVNAGIWANRLKITAGANRVDAAHATASLVAGSGPAPAFAIDVASLGGMYANKIVLVGTEAGVGVRNAGTLGAAAGDILVTADGLLTNSGHMAAAGALNLSTAAGIDNTGTLYARGDLGLAAAGGILNPGIVAARGNATLAASRVDSAAGSVLGAGIRDDGTLAPEGDLAIHATLDIVARGQNLAGGDMTLDAGSLDLSDSQSAARNLTLAAGAGDIDASRATIAADRTLTANAAQTLRSRSAHLSAGFIDLRARDIDNTDGDIVGAGDSALALTGGLDNTRGTLAANAGTLSLAAAALDNTDGRLRSQGDLAVTLAGDYIHRGEFQANGNARLTTGGHLDNRAQLRAGDSLAVTAASLDNAAGAEIAAADTRLAVAGTLTNRGLIDGTDTRIDAGRLDNLGTGRLYGDTLSIAAATLNNDAEAGTAPVIAARSRLDIGARDILNREHALIFSAGDMGIGGALDAGRRALGPADTLANASATIEALGNLAVDASELRNTNEHFATAMAETNREHRTEYAGAGSPNRYARSEVSLVRHEKFTRLYTPEGGYYNNWYLFDYDRVTNETQVTASDPARILSGGAMTLTADTLLNDKSHIVAGAALTATLGSLDNLDAGGTRSVADGGTATYFYRKKRDGDDTQGIVVSGYAPAPLLNTFTLAAARFDSHTAPPASGTAVPGLTTGSAAAIAGVPVNTVLPASSLFSTHPGSTARYLIETDPRFASYRHWLTSDWMLAQLGIDPAAMHKRLGDGFYEQRLITEQVAALTGRRFLAGYSDDEAQYRALMAAGATWARQWNLIPGVALTPEQMAQLTTDMVWLIEREVTLPDGRKESVLAPQLYARVREGDVDGAGALISANSLQLDLTGDLTNLGTIAGREVVTLSAENIRNLGGRIGGRDAWLAARQDIHNLGGSLEGEDRLTVLAGRDLRVESTTRASASAQGTRTNLDRLAGLYVTNPGGTLVAAAGRDLDLIAAAIINAAPTAATSLPSPASGRGAGGEGAGEGRGEGETTLLAGRNLTLGTLTEAGTLALGDAKHNRREAYSREIGSAIQVEGDLILSAGSDLAARAATIASQSGAVSVSVGRDLALTAGEATQSFEERHKSKSKGFLSTKKTSTFDAVADTKAVGTQVSGESVSLDAGRNLTLTGSSAVSQRLTLLTAGRDIAIEAAEERHSERHEKKEKQSGLFGSGGAGFTIGSRSLAQKTTDDAVTAAASTVGSIEGDVSILAAGAYRQTGSDVTAPQGDIDIEANRIDIVEARERRTVTQEVKTKQSGLTVSLSSPVISAVQTAQAMSQAAQDTRDPRMRALAAANVALSGYNAFNALSAGQGGGVILNLSLGSSKSKSSSTQTSDTAAGSILHAGRDLTLTATPSPHAGEGRGEGAGDITVQGSALSAGRHLNLTAGNDIRLLAAGNTTELKSSSKSSSASIGVAIDLATLGVSATAGANAARGRAEGRDSVWTNAKVSAGDTATLTSGADAPQEIPLGDTTLRGAVVEGRRVAAQVGGHLSIESLQDESTYRSRNSSAGFTLSVPITGGSLGGSVSAGSSRIESDYVSVTEQSALRAGDGGFAVAVQGDTALTGGAITGTQQAVEENRNRFATGGQLTLSDIRNKAEFEGKSVSVSLGAGLSLDGRLAPQGTGAGLGRDSGRAESTTLAAISGIAGNTTARTGDAETGIAPIFDANRVQREIDAQAKITQMFGQLAPRAGAEFANNQRDALKDKAKQESDPDQKAELLDEAKRWDEGGAYRIALHAAIGGLAGNAQGALGAGAAAAAAPLLDDLQDGITQSLKEAGAGDSVAKLAGQLVSGATAAGIGAALGGTTGAAAGLNVDANNRQLHPTEARLIKNNAGRYAVRRGGISIEQAEAELTQQALRNVDSAHTVRLADDDPQAQAFLAELGAGQQQTAGFTGQSYQLFAADQATRENHAMFGQYAKTSPAAQALLDNAYRAVFRPADGQILAGVTGTYAGALTGSDLALNDAARDTGNIRNQPPTVQWAVLGQLRQERTDNLGRQKALLEELQAMNERADTGAQAAQRRGEIVDALALLDRENSVLRQASQLHILTMGSAGLLRPIDQRELIEGFGEGRSLAGVSLRGLSAASIGARLRELKEVIAQSRAATAAARAEAEAIAKARVENHVNADNDIFTGTGQNTKGDTSPDFKGNTTLDEHLSTGGPHRKTVYGAHSDEAYHQAVKDKGFTDLPDKRETLAPGVYENRYLDKNGVERIKTTYDPAYWSDAQMQAMSRQAVVKVGSNAARGLGQLPVPKSGGEVQTTIDGVPFIVTIDKGKLYAFPGQRRGQQ